MFGLRATASNNEPKIIPIPTPEPAIDMVDKPAPINCNLMFNKTFVATL
jgi:hypothetical protein